MIKIIYKKSSLFLLVLVILMSFIIGCQKQPPEGVSQEFYNDILNASDDLIKIIKNTPKADMGNEKVIKSDTYTEFCEKYYKNDKLTTTEQKAFSSLARIVLYSEMNFSHYYKTGEAISNDKLTEEVDEFSNILDINIDANEITIGN